MTGKLFTNTQLLELVDEILRYVAATDCGLSRTSVAVVFRYLISLNFIELSRIFGYAERIPRIFSAITTTQRQQLTSEQCLLLLF